MRLLVLPLLLLISVGAACKKAATTPTEAASPVPTGPPQVWEGTARFSESVPDSEFPQALPLVTTFEGTVTWQRGPITEAIPPGAVSYALTSGQIRVTLAGHVCEYRGEAQFAVKPWAAPDEFNTLVVREDGSYYGSVYQEVQFSATRSSVCSVRTVTFERIMALLFTGRVTNGRIRGELAPEVIGGTTETGSWDFGAR